MIDQAAARIVPEGVPLSIDKQECLYDASAGFNNSFDWLDEEAASGHPAATKSLFINLTTLNTVSQPFISFDLHRQSEDPLPTAFLEIKQTRSFKPSKVISKEAEKIKSERAAAMTGGESAILPTCPRLFDLKTSYKVHFKPGNHHVSLPEKIENWTSHHVKTIPEVILKLCRDIAASEGAAAGATMIAAFDDPTTVIVEDLAVADKPKQISPHPAEWKCEDCGRRKNLWLNLSDGYLGCGRRQYGVPESGCTGDREGAAIRHYADHPDFHLAVKLGTISSVSADVYSYLQDAPVHDKDLDLHLRRLGLDRSKLSQTERSTQDLAVERNQALDFGVSLDEENGRQVSGVGKVGVVNIGNSCYIGSLMQALSRVLNSKECWWKSPTQMPWLQACSSFLTTTGQLKSDLQNSLAFQIIRLVFPLVSENPSLVPQWHKTYAARYKYLVDELGKEVMDLFPKEDGTIKAGTPSPSGLKRIIGAKNREFSTAFQQDVEEFYQVLFNAIVDEEKKFTIADKKGIKEMLRANVELKEMVNSETKAVRIQTTDVPLIALPMPKDQTNLSLLDLFKRWQMDGNCKQGISFFPPFLMIQVRRMAEDSNYQAVKINNPIEIPEELDLEFLRAKGLEEGEKLDVPEFSADKKETLIAFGFNETQIANAAKALGSDVNVERITEWLFNHGDSAPTEFDPAPLMELGFERDVSVAALKAFKGDVGQAANALFNGEEINETPTEVEAVGGDGHYRLCSVIVHLGSNAFSGHYVTYVREEGQWLLYNDDRVSSVPKLDLRYGYLYLYLQV